jgi:hypothetical protein
LNEFETWFITFIEEKGLSDITIEIEVNNYWNFIPLSVLQEFLFNCHEAIQQVIKNKLVQLDFCNMNISHYLEYIAKGVVQFYDEGIIFL